MASERRDSRREGYPRRTSRLGLPPSASSTSIRSGGAGGGAAFETVDELDDLDQLQRPPRKVSQLSNGGARERRISRRVSRLAPPAPAPSGQVNPAFQTSDELDDIDRKYRKASMAINVPSRRESRIVGPGKEVKAEKEYFFKRKCDRTTIILVTLCITFFLTTEIFISVFLMERYKDPPPEVCQSDSCVKFARVLKHSIDLSADPCDDFYTFACGNFQHQDAYGDRYLNLDDLVDDELALRLHDVFLKFRRENRTKEHYEQKALQFHSLCMSPGANNASAELLTEVLQNLSWPLLSPAPPRPISLQFLLMESHQYGIQSLFQVSRLPDPAQPRNPYWTIEEGKLPLPYVVYDSERHRHRYRTFIKDLIVGLKQNVGQTEIIADEGDYQKIADFEAELSNVNHEPVYFRLSIEEFSRAYPTINRHYDLVQYFRRLSANDLTLNLTASSEESGTITEKTMIILKNRDYFMTLDAELAKLSERDQAVYLGWRILYHYLDLLTDDHHFWSIIHGFWKSIGSRKMESQARWKKCAQFALNAFPDSGLALYRKEYFSPVQSQKIDDLLDKLTSSAIKLVDAQQWLSDSDKETATKKFEGLTRQLPYSEELFATNLTSHLYSLGFITYDSFFPTLRTFQRVRQHFVLAGVYHTGVKFVELLNFNFGADYRLQSNEAGLIGLFPKTLVPPFFDTSMPKFAQYSTLGFQYAQELAHVVDYEWFMLNKSGEIDHGPSTDTFQHYHSALGYLLELYRNTSILLQLPVDTETLYEDSADQAALRLAFWAYQDEIKAANDDLIPGFAYRNFDFHHMFFLTFAQYFCVNRHAAVIKDVHKIGFSHPRLRLTALVQNSEEFATAFKCDRAGKGQQLFDIPDPERKLKYKKNITAKQIDEWYHWFERKPGLPTWPVAW